MPLQEQLIRRCCMITHGGCAKGKVSPEYISWRAMMQRCYYSKHVAYYRYGGKGIGVCKRWRESFLAFLLDMGKRPEGHTIERLNNAKGYSPKNCRWATRKEQNNNKGDTRYMEFQGQTLTMKGWAREKGINYASLAWRLSQGWTLEKALTTPIAKKKRRVNG